MRTQWACPPDPLLPPVSPHPLPSASCRYFWPTSLRYSSWPWCRVFSRKMRCSFSPQRSTSDIIRSVRKSCGAREESGLEQAWQSKAPGVQTPRSLARKPLLCEAAPSHQAAGLTCGGLLGHESRGSLMRGHGDI